MSRATIGVIATAGALAGGCFFLLAGAREAGGRAERVLPGQARAEVLAREDAWLSPPSPTEAQEGSPRLRREATELASDAAAVEMDRGQEERALAAVRELAALLERTLERAAWDHEGRSLARSLGASSAPVLAAAAGDELAAEGLRVAAAELLRQLVEIGAAPDASLGPDSLDALRRFWNRPGGDPSLATAAARALAFFGSTADRAALIAALASAPEPEERRAAAWALSGGRGREAVLELAGLTSLATDPALARSALPALEALLRSRAADQLEATDRAFLARVLGERLVDASVPAATRARALGALAAPVLSAESLPFLERCRAGETDERIRAGAALLLARRDEL